MGYQRLPAPDIDRIFRGETVSGLSEWQLLERYLEGRDEIAFEALVARHGPMVLRVCRRMLADTNDVEDAFQATFLVLVRRARQLAPRDAIGPWLHGVAARVALRARSETARRRRLAPIACDLADAAAAAEPALADRELGEVLERELAQLPTKYRAPVVLCYLEGQTHEQAARELAWPLGTVKGRLARARDLLRGRLARRGLTPTAGAFALVLSRDSSAAVGRDLLDRTVKAALDLSLGRATSQVVSTSIASLVEGVLTSMMLTKLKWGGAAVLLSALALTGAGVMARQSAGPEPEQPRAARGRVVDFAKAEAPKPAAAPAGSLADLRDQLLQAARVEWAAAYREYQNNSSGLDRVYQASRRLKDAEEQIAGLSSEEEAAPARSHFDRVRAIARIQHANPSPSDLQKAQVKSFVSEAELWLARAGANRAEKPASPEERVAAQPATPQPKGHRSRTGPSTSDTRGQDPRSRRILEKLDEPISMSFKDETPLEDVLKYIKQATTTASYSGIPIYVDPIGLQEAEKSMTSTVRNMDLEGVPLRRTLQLALKQLELIYFVDDGILCITSQESEGTLGPSMQEPSPIDDKLQKAERGDLTVDEMKELIEVLKMRQQVNALAEPRGGGGDGEISRPGASPSDDAKRHDELLKLLVQETRELVDALKAAKPAAKGAQTK
jgi:RNA polymerase sigma factor (sigma-70 family)